MLSQIRPALVLLALMTLLTGFAYPLAVMGLGQAIFPQQANGSLLYRNDQVVGSDLIGQPFADPAYFHGRPSAVDFDANGGLLSTGSNLGPTNRALIERIKGSVQALRTENDGLAAPVDLVTTSGSGLDPDISPAAAGFQVKRIAQARSLSEEAVRQLIAECTQERQLGLLGEPRVNVLQLNLALDELTAK